MNRAPAPPRRASLGSPADEERPAGARFLALKALAVVFVNSALPVVMPPDYDPGVDPAIHELRPQKDGVRFGDQRY